MNKTQDLLSKIKAGTHRVDQYGFVSRWVESRNEWVSTTAFRKDVVLRVRAALIRANTAAQSI